MVSMSCFGEKNVIIILHYSCSNLITDLTYTYLKVRLLELTGVNFVIIVGAGLMASAEREPITGVWGGAPSWVQGRASGQGLLG